jgi:hypothetical protein
VFPEDRELTVLLEQPVRQARKVLPGSDWMARMALMGILFPAHRDRKARLVEEAAGLGQK